METSTPCAQVWQRWAGPPMPTSGRGSLWFLWLSQLLLSPRTPWMTPGILKTSWRRPRGCAMRPWQPFGRNVSPASSRPAWSSTRGCAEADRDWLATRWWGLRSFSAAWLGVGSEESWRCFFDSAPSSKYRGISPPRDSPTPAGCPAVQLKLDPIYPETALDPTSSGLSPTRLPHHAHPPTSTASQKSRCFWLTGCRSESSMTASFCCCWFAKSCPTLCNPMDCSLTGSSVHGISQAKVLEWVAISFSQGSSWPRHRTQVSYRWIAPVGNLEH